MRTKKAMRRTSTVRRRATRLEKAGAPVLRKAERLLRKTWRESVSALDWAQADLQRKTRRLLKKTGFDTHRAVAVVKGWLDFSSKKPMYQQQG